ncbi:MAG: sulfatase-like hydrolase/transferase [Deltaproteobacteria bacterium]|nr:sulfatase-like hydrolase/transferase [Deltaproteobacteria bacterium]
MAQPSYNLVLIVADTYRKDNAALSPAAELRSPFFDKLQPFYAFDRCFSSAPWTLPACASILSGIDSSSHGYFFHDRPLGRPTLGRYLNGKFQKVAIVNNRNLREFTGFPGDFDKYWYYPKHEEPFDRARQVLTDTAGKRPFFFFFHTNIPHDYFREVSRDYYREMFPDDHDWFLLGARVGTWTGLPAQQRAKVRSIYDASTRHMEEQLAAFLELIDLDQTIICFVADHGEGFDYDRARIHHGGRLHDDLLRVPMVLRLPGGAPREYHEKLAAAQEQSCGIVDILPTLLQLVEYTVPESISGRSLLEPVSTGRNRILVAEDKRYLYRPTRQRYNVNLRGQNTSLWSRLKNLAAQKTLIRGFNLKAYIRYPYKLIITSYHHPPYVSSLGTLVAENLFFSRDPLVQLEDIILSLELFDLEADPMESHNLLSGTSRLSLRNEIGDRLGDLTHMVVDIVGKTFSVETAVQRAPAQ